MAYPHESMSSQSVRKTNLSPSIRLVLSHSWVRPSRRLWRRLCSDARPAMLNYQVRIGWEYFHGCPSGQDLFRDYGMLRVKAGYTD